ncbi:hypothetical protein X756_24355 [Mesorhizobium sp. LSHC412B00]|nr:hypothetical protein X756_24355 [Mesorhizobium sp. LSHC412B00]
MIWREMTPSTRIGRDIHVRQPLWHHEQGAQQSAPFFKATCMEDVRADAEMRCQSRKTQAAFASETGT